MNINLCLFSAAGSIAFQQAEPRKLAGSGVTGCTTTRAQPEEFCLRGCRPSQGKNTLAPTCRS